MPNPKFSMPDVLSPVQELEVSTSSKIPEQPVKLDSRSLEIALEKFATDLKREFISERERERERIRQAFQEKIALIEKKANQKVSEKLLRARGRDRAKIAEREKRMDHLFGNVMHLAKEVAEQKSQLKICHDQLRQKLIQSGKIQMELCDVGILLEEQIKSLGGPLLDQHLIKSLMEEGGEE